MSFKKRWELAYYSVNTRIGKLVFVLIIIRIIWFLIKFNFELVKYDSGTLISQVMGTIIFFGIEIVLTCTCLFIIWLIGRIVFWILNDHYEWEDVFDLISTTWKIVFGDYDGKFDFLRGNNGKM